MLLYHTNEKRRFFYSGLEFNNNTYVFSGFSFRTAAWKLWNCFLTAFTAIFTIVLQSRGTSF